ncbi:hypothetical protein C8J56DRAFT_1063926 [Mycena floridula]|nr:hypothetical protein C8J56DRAFT_1063926 [Mycena floridula]
MSNGFHPKLDDIARRRTLTISSLLPITGEAMAAINPSLAPIRNVTAIAMAVIRVTLAEHTDALCLAFSGLQEFPALRELTLDFFSDFLENDFMHADIPEKYHRGPSMSLLFQQEFLTAIAKNVVNKTSLPSLTTLNLLNLIAAPGSAFYKEESFQRFISIPKHLNISVLWEADEEDDDLYEVDIPPYAEDLQEFWTKHVTGDIVRRSCNRRLESLHLTSPQFVQMPCSPIVPFAHLTTLSLSKVIFGRQGAVEDLIVRHKSTLRHLMLHQYPIYHTRLTPPTRFWSDLLERFARELVEFASVEITDTLYAFKSLEWESGLWSHTGQLLHMCRESRQVEDVVRDDKQALESFRFVVETRALQSTRI